MGFSEMVMLGFCIALGFCLFGVVASVISSLADGSLGLLGAIFEAVGKLRVPVFKNGKFSGTVSVFKGD